MKRCTAFALSSFAILACTLCVCPLSFSAQLSVHDSVMCVLS